MRKQWIPGPLHSRGRGPGDEARLHLHPVLPSRMMGKKVLVSVGDYTWNVSFEMEETAAEVGALIRAVRVAFQRNGVFAMQK